MGQYIKLFEEFVNEKLDGYEVYSFLESKLEELNEEWEYKADIHQADDDIILISFDENIDEKYTKQYIKQLRKVVSDNYKKGSIRMKQIENNTIQISY